MQIGEMLVRAKAVTPADLDEAVSWQVLYGGRLGTNLLELGLVEEKVLAESLGRQLAVEWMHGDIEIAENMVQAVPAVVARRHEIIPWKLEGKRFKILCITPSDHLALFDEIGFRLGKNVKPVVAPEFRIHQALRRFYGSVRQMRALDFGMKPKGKREQQAERQAEQEALEKKADLMDDDEFAAIYAQVMEQRGQAETRPPPGAAKVAPVNVPAAPPRLAPPPAPVAPKALPAGWTAAPPPPVPAGWTAAPPPPPAPRPSWPALAQTPYAGVPQIGPPRQGLPSQPPFPAAQVGPPHVGPPQARSATLPPYGPPQIGPPRQGPPTQPPMPAAAPVGPPQIGPPQQARPPAQPPPVGPPVQAQRGPATIPPRTAPAVSPPVVQALAPPVPAEPAPEEFDAALLLTPAEDDPPLVDAELIEDDDEPTDPGLHEQQLAAAFADLEQQLVENEPPPPPPEDLSPLSFKDAVASIAKAEGREGVARAVLRYARTNAARAVLLNVQGDVALGWDAVGDELTPDLARRIAFPLSVPSAFRLVRESRSHYIGPLGKESGNVRFLKLAGKKWPASAVLLPVLFRGKVAYILYVDNGHKQQVNPDVGELLILSQNITRSMEQLVAKRQAAPAPRRA